MARSCCVPDCGKIYTKAEHRDFYHIPTVRIDGGEDILQRSTNRRKAWIAAINRKDFYLLKEPIVCSNHFHSGKPAYLMAENDVDWVPSLKMPGKEKENTVKAGLLPNRHVVPKIIHLDHDYCLASSGESSAGIVDSMKSNSIQNEVEEGDIHFVDMDLATATPQEEDVQTENSSSVTMTCASGDFISPDHPMHAIPPESTNPCCRLLLAEIRLLRNKVQEKVADHYVAVTELKALRQELSVAKEQLVRLRSQLEENTHALCAYLASGEQKTISFVVKR